jgi:hypothetical protein
MFIAYVATATIGNRLPQVRLLDALGNILMQTAATTAITASQTPKLIVMAGLAYLSQAAPLSQILPWPVGMPVPFNCSVQILDGANIDVNDTVAANIVLI